MGILLWIILGAVAGWLASIITQSSHGLLQDIVLGIIGGFIGGLIMNLLGGTGVTGFNVYSLLVASAGAVVLILLGRLFHK
jgi:uncharacterized membrane protein YeaQ/YmgE (transglycosylase-associated protein family)